MPNRKQARTFHAARSLWREQDELDARIEAEDEEVEEWDPEAPAAADSEPSIFDSEIDLRDEDEGADDEVDHSDDLVETSASVLLPVHRGQVLVQPPDWHLGRKPSDRLEERSLRFAMLSRLANWLNSERREFLAEPVPDPYLRFSQGKTDLNMPAPVLEEGLYSLTRCSEMGDFSTFHRHMRHALLKWPDFRLPLVELVSHRSRTAWVGAAILDFCVKRRVATRTFWSEAKVPKGKNSAASRSVLRRIPLTNPWMATPEDYVIAACLKVGVGLAAVMACYGALFGHFQQEGRDET